MPRFLKCRQTITKANPGKVVTLPGVMRRRKQIGVVETTGGDVDEPDAIAMLVCQGAAATRAEGAAHGLGRMELRRVPPKQLKLPDRKSNPGDDRRRCDAPTALTMTHHAVRRHATDAIANCAANASAFSL